MADSIQTQRQAHPLPAYNYRVTIEDQTMSFSKVSGISTQYEHVTYRHGLSFWEGEGIKTFRFDSYITVVLERGTALGASPLFLAEWMVEGKGRPIDVTLCDESGTPVLGWKIATAIPVKLDAPTFDANSNEVAIERVELKAKGISLVEI